MFKLYVDGKEVEVHNDVKVVWDLDTDDTPATEEELHAILTHEGLILDRMERTKGNIEVIATAGYEKQDLAELTH